MKVEVQLMESGFFFNKSSGMHPEKPLVNVLWVKENGKKYAAISTIENIFDPIPEYVTIPETVRLLVIDNYGDALEEYCDEEVKK